MCHIQVEWENILNLCVTHPLKNINYKIFQSPNDLLLNSCISKVEARWPSGRASDFGARGRGFDPHSGRSVVSLRKIHLPPKRTGNTQEAVAPSRHD